MIGTAHNLEGMLPDAFGAAAPIGTSPMEIQSLFNKMMPLANRSFDLGDTLNRDMDHAFDHDLG